MRKRIYLAGPMSIGDRIDNLTGAMKAYRRLMEMGFAPFCPQLSFFAEPFIKQTHHQWLEADLPWVECADAILRLPGTSVGADMEEAWARENGIPVFDDAETLFNFFGEQQ